MLIRGACPHDCPDTCAWEVTVEDGRAVKLVGIGDHPFTHGALCAKVNHYLDRVYGDERLLYPLRRVGPKGSREFERVSWDEALTDIGDRLRRITAEHGGEAVMPYSYMGTQGMLQGSSLDRRFFARLGATRLVRAICGSAGSSGAAVTLGTNLGILPEDIRHSRFIVLWGTNTVVTNVHLWRFIREAKAAGATVVLVDPLRTRTAESVEWHVRPLPGTDAALALGLMHVIVRDGLHDADYVERYTLGFDDLCERLREYPPDQVEKITGVPQDEVERLARAFATTRPSVVRLLIGLEHHQHGAMTYRAVSCLPALVGAWRDHGGGLLFLTASLFNALNGPGLEMRELEDKSIREVNMVQLGRALTSLDPPIRALIVYGSNPAAIAPNQSLVMEGLRREDLFTVVHEQVLTDTASHADYVLPATTQIEHLDLLWSWGHDYVTLNQPAIPALGEAVSTTELFRRLATAMGFTEPYLQTSDSDLLDLVLESDHPYMEGITRDTLTRTGWARLRLPQPWLPYAEGGFPTPSGRCEFRSDRAAHLGLDPLPGYAPARESRLGDPALAARYPLQLLTPKSALHFLNSSYTGLKRHREAEVEPYCEIHPADAAARGVDASTDVRVFNDRGTVTARARISERVPAGVVAVPFGWWASLSPGGTSANSLTPDGLSDLGRGGDFHDALVQVERA